MFTNFPDRLDEVLGKDAIKGKGAANRAAEASEECREGSKEDKEKVEKKDLD